MKKIIYRTASSVLVCMALSAVTFAQSDGISGPPPPPLPGEGSDKSQSEIVIRQKGDKDAKLTLEIKNGQYFINGKPLEKYDDGNLIIVKKDLNDLVITSPGMGYGGSHFRIQPFNEDELDNEDARGQLNNMYRDRQRQKSVEKSIRVKMNSAFLGVSSKKTEKGGATVLEVTKGSPAEKSGIKKGDIITKVNDEKIESPDALYEAIHKYKPGEKVKIAFIRDGKSQVVVATLQKTEFSPDNFNYSYNFKMPPIPNMEGMPPNAWWFPREPKLGIKAQDAEDGKGVNVLQVEDSSAAYKAGLKKGDIILQFDGKEVNSTNELIDQLQEARQKSIIKVKIQRGTTTQEIEVKIPRKLKTAEL